MLEALNLVILSNHGLNQILLSLQAITQTMSKCCRYDHMLLIPAVQLSLALQTDSTKPRGVTWHAALITLAGVLA